MDEKRMPYGLSDELTQIIAERARLFKRLDEVNDIVKELEDHHNGMSTDLAALNAISDRMLSRWIEYRSRWLDRNSK